MALVVGMGHKPPVMACAGFSEGGAVGAGVQQPVQQPPCAGPEGFEVLCVEFRCLYREDVCGVPEGAPSRRGARTAQNRRLPGVYPAHRILWGFFLAKSKICCGAKSADCCCERRPDAVQNFAVKVRMGRVVRLFAARAVFRVLPCPICVAFHANASVPSLLIC